MMIELGDAIIYGFCFMVYTICCLIIGGFIGMYLTE